MSTGFEVPTIDISAFDGDDPAASARVVDAVRAACETVGFFLLADRGGVPEDLVAGALDASRGFFERPLEEKMRVASLRKGYIPVDGCDNAVRPTSLHEKFSCSRVDLDAIDVSDPYYDPSASAQAELYFGEDNRWPDAPGGFRHAWETYYVAMESLTRRLLRIFARALDAKGGDDFFVDRCRRHVSNLVALRYPPLHPDDGGTTERVKPHTDPTDVTILAFEHGPSGLQVLPDGCGDWIDVPAATNSLLVNLGDVTRFWTNDAWRSTRHRVTCTPRNEGEGNEGNQETDDRLSLVFFHAPDYDALIDCEDIGHAVVNADVPRRYPAFKSGERSHFNQLVRNEQGLPDRQTLREDNSRGD